MLAAEICPIQAIISFIIIINAFSVKLSLCKNSESQRGQQNGSVWFNFLPKTQLGHRVNFNHQ